MPSDKQVEIARTAASEVWKEAGITPHPGTLLGSADSTTGVAIAMRAIKLYQDSLTAAEQAEPAPAQCKHPVWGQDKDGTRVCAKCGLVEHPAARAGAVKDTASGIASEVFKYLPKGFLNSSEDVCVLHGAIQEAAIHILAALDPAEPATDTEPFTYFYRYSDPMSGKAVWRSSGGLWNGQRPSETLPLYTRPPEPATDVEPDFAASISRVISDESEDGADCGWKPCSGCHETNEGYETGHYPYSKMFGCHVGAGCSECGGLGVVWEHWDKSTLEEMSQEHSRPPESRLREAAREAVNCITHHAEDNENTRWVLSLLNSALAQED